MFIEAFIQFFGMIVFLFQLFQPRDFIIQHIGIVVEENMIFHRQNLMNIAINPTSLYLAG